VDPAQAHRDAVRELLDKDEAAKSRDMDMDLSTAAGVLDDIRNLLEMSVEVRDQMAVLVHREGPEFIDRMSKLLGKSEDEIVAAVIEARKDLKIDMDSYRLQHHPKVLREMKERFNIDLKPGQD
jgi:hypothetical protein